MNLEQVRARNAFAAAGEARSDEARQELLGLARQLPATFQRNGLLATWAFLLAGAGPDGRKSAAHAAVLAALLAHLGDPEVGLLGNGGEVPPEASPVEVFERHWTRSDPPLTGGKLRALTAEAIAYAGWLKRAAEALCDVGKGGGS